MQSLRADDLTRAVNAELTEAGASGTLEVLSLTVAAEDLPLPCGGGLGTLLPEEDACLRPDGRPASAGFVRAASASSGSGCCAVCADEGRYASGVDGPCLQCAAFQRVNEAGSGCDVISWLVACAALGALAAVPLLFGCCLSRRRVVPPPWLWLADACDNRWRGAPCRCGRGGGCRCDRWKACFRPYYFRCPGCALHPGGHWVLRHAPRPACGELCNACAAEGQVAGNPVAECLTASDEAALPVAEAGAWVPSAVHVDLMRVIVSL